MRILLAEDNRDTSVLLQAALKMWGYDPIVAETGSEALEVMKSPDAPELAIIDWMMPGADGLEVCRQVRSWSGRPYAYIMLLTCRDQRVDIVEGLKAGADDYLIKPIDLQELEARLSGARRILALQRQLIEARDALHEQATHDTLTGLWNRKAILDQLNRELHRARRDKTSLGLVICDLDHFKTINDEHGHLAGDAVLREVARRMRASMRPYDAIGRYGGEEFFVLLPACDVTTCLSLAERLRRCVRVQTINAAGAEVRVTVSLGLACCGEDFVPEAETLIAEADAALYQAKNAGRDRVEMAPPNWPAPGFLVMESTAVP